MAQRSVLRALAVALALVCDVAFAKEADDCCPAHNFCCGNVCKPKSLQPVISCIQIVGGCCEPPPSPGNPCEEEPKVVGPCEALIPSWSFVEESGKCEFFSYGGCEGTANRFDSEEGCNETCGVEDELCICTKEYAPVCDPATGTTYGNACEAACDEVAPENLVDGPCDAQPPQDCICPAVVDPVCSLDTGTTYNNECEAGCAGDDGNLSKGECGCICPAVFDPVCSLDTGTTYGNECEAGCAGDGGNLAQGECEVGCICPAVFDPVCSLDTGTTYGNECEAGCAGDDGNLSKGECGSKEKK